MANIQRHPRAEIRATIVTVEVMDGKEGRRDFKNGFRKDGELEYRADVKVKNPVNPQSGANLFKDYGTFFNTYSSSVFDELLPGETYDMTCKISPRKTGNYPNITIENATLVSGHHMVGAGTQEESPVEEVEEPLPLTPEQFDDEESMGQVTPAHETALPPRTETPPAPVMRPVPHDNTDANMVIHVCAIIKRMGIKDGVLRRLGE